MIETLLGRAVSQRRRHSRSKTQRKKSVRVRYFNPDKGFFGERMVIFAESDDPTEEAPNPYARAEMLDYFDPGFAALYQAEKMELSSVLGKLSMAEEKKEIRYLEQKINSLQKSPVFEGKSVLMDKLKKINDEHSPGWISAIVNLLMQSEQGLTNITRELEDGQNLLKNSVFSRNFGQYLKDYMLGAIEGNRQGAKFAEEFINGNKTMDQIIESYLDQVFNSIPADSANVARQQYKEVLIQRLRSGDKGDIPDDWVNNLNIPITVDEIKNLVLKFRKIKKTRTGREKALKTVIRDLSIDVAKGLAAEFVVSANGIKYTGKGFHTGAINAKADAIIIDRLTTEVTINQEQVIQKLFSKPEVNADAQQKILKAIDAVKRIVGRKSFLLSVSSKDYRGGGSFTIGSGSTKNMMARLNQIASQLDGYNIDLNRFAFELNNMIKGGFLENKIEDARKQIGFLCAAWMFDDITNMFAMSGTDNMLHIYYLNGVYISLSELLAKAASQVNTINEKKLVEVGMQMDSTAVAQMKKVYQESREKYPGSLTEDQASTIEKELPGRWESVRDAAENNSSINIKLNQQVIREASEAIRELLR